MVIHRLPSITVKIFRVLARTMKSYCTTFKYFLYTGYSYGSHCFKCHCTEISTEADPEPYQP